MFKNVLYLDIMKLQIHCIQVLWIVVKFIVFNSCDISCLLGFGHLD